MKQHVPSLNMDPFSCSIVHKFRYEFRMLLLGILAESNTVSSPLLKKKEEIVLHPQR
uniref:Uncharacterized protein n=1 Tax=Setaria italica TaxID=4555 RepID=K3XP76_SETIT